jgi:hypothetical protein
MYSHPPVQPLPFSVSRKLFTFLLLNFLTGVDTVEAVILGAMRKDHPIELTGDESAEILSFGIALSTYADAVRGFLLQTKISSKSDVYGIAKNPKFIALIKDLNETFLEHVDLPALNKVMAGKFRELIGKTAKALKGQRL